MVTINKDEILKKGYVDVKVRAEGMRQSHRLHVKKQQTAHGLVPMLVAQHYIPRKELVKLAEQFQLPVKHKDVVALPKGKMPKDFAEPGTKPAKVKIEADTVEAEVED
ncbi:hypothetical protein GF318_03890 [Candidatus Micrarchaeota archaeon]|nr:hypothetical protein [Candidatus Micrarchaeota archaeon]